MSRKFYDVKYKGKSGILNTTVLAKSIGEIKNSAQKLGYKVSSIEPHRKKGQWGF